jgi:hypothetical protein
MLAAKSWAGHDDLWVSWMSNRLSFVWGAQVVNKKTWQNVIEGIGRIAREYWG